jgi:GT2 family glycosyltransferase
VADERVVLERVVVVDNASSDGSVEDWTIFFSARSGPQRGQPRLRGGLQPGSARQQRGFLLFLNPDTVCFRARWPRRSLFWRSPNTGTRARRHSARGRAGACPSVLHLVPDAQDVFLTDARLNHLLPRRFPGHFMDDWDHGTTRRVDHVMGAFYLIRRSVFQEVNGFDERFFVYLEDLDLSLRTRRAGWEIVFLASARVYHRSGGTSEQVKAMRLFYALHSRIRYGYKHFAWWTATSLALGTLFLEPAARVARAIALRSPCQIGETLRGYGLLLRALGRSPWRGGGRPAGRASAAGEHS